MNLARGRELWWFVGAWVVSVGAGGGVAVADQWMVPREIERWSENGEFVAKVTPSSKRAFCLS
jgi:hypothetical protein